MDVPIWSAYPTRSSQCRAQRSPNEREFNNRSTTCSWACGDSSGKDQGGSQADPSQADTSSDNPAPSWKPLCTAIADGESWRIHVSFGTPIPDDARPTVLRVTSGEAAVELDLNDRPEPISVLLPRGGADYLVSITDDRGRTWTREASFE